MDQEKMTNAFDHLIFQAIETIRNADLRNDKEAQRVLQTIDNALDEMGYELTEHIPDEVIRSYFEGYEKGAEELGMQDFKRAILDDGTIDPAFNRRIHIEAVEEVTDDILLDLTAAIAMAKESADYAINNALSTLKSGISERLITGISKDVIAQRVQDAFLKDGLTSFITEDGKELPLDYYSRMITFTKLSEVENTGHLNRYEESGTDLVEISSNNPTCEECAKHRGMVYSRSGNDERFPKLPEKLLPLHPHCQCTYKPISLEYLTDEELQAIIERVEQGTDKDPRSEKEAKRYSYYQKQRARARAEKKQFAKMTAYLGADMPETLPAFRRMKRAKTFKYQELYSNYLSATHTKNRG